MTNLGSLRRKREVVEKKEAFFVFQTFFKQGLFVYGDLLINIILLESAGVIKLFL